MSLRILLVADVDLPSAIKLVEWILATDYEPESEQQQHTHHQDASHGPTSWSLCCIIGPFAHRERPELVTPEERAADEGEMSAIIAQLENIVCRAVYVPGPNDPVMPAFTGRYGTPQLTGTSQNINSKVLRLLPGLCIAGYTEAPGQDADRCLAEARALCSMQPTVAHTKIAVQDSIAGTDTLLLLSCTNAESAIPTRTAVASGETSSGWLENLWKRPEFVSRVGAHFWSGYTPPCSSGGDAEVLRGSAQVPQSCVPTVSLRLSGQFGAVDLVLDEATAKWRVDHVSYLQIPT
ncbi:hypothetical protein JKP88DRAFT_333818 [Tribonema minus]|uniref:Uncharacterized protein n=1 Tax=Tribonema minus TaxID=303371 RepID=A0A835YTR0_9STRA|nr:hypothetical protein JKP88DRAFT_333818 [Tribonema minus]